MKIYDFNVDLIKAKQWKEKNSISARECKEHTLSELKKIMWEFYGDLNAYFPGYVIGSIRMTDDQAVAAQKVHSSLRILCHSIEGRLDQTPHDIYLFRQIEDTLDALSIISEFLKSTGLDAHFQIVIKNTHRTYEEILKENQP